MMSWYLDKFGGEGFDYVEVAAYPFRVNVWVHAWHNGRRGGNDPSASIVLYNEGNKVSEKSDSNFDTYNLPIDYQAALDSGTQTDFRIAVENWRADTLLTGIIVYVQRIW